jgi:hypothetical protein
MSTYLQVQLFDTKPDACMVKMCYSGAAEQFVAACNGKH